MLTAIIIVHTLATITLFVGIYKYIQLREALKALKGARLYL